MSTGSRSILPPGEPGATHTRLGITPLHSAPSAPSDTPPPLPETRASLVADVQQVETQLVQAAPQIVTAYRAAPGRGVLQKWANSRKFSGMVVGQAVTLAASVQGMLPPHEGAIIGAALFGVWTLAEAIVDAASAFGQARGPVQRDGQ